MTTSTSAVAVSHVGKVRSSNQDSGYSGKRLFVVADGMGGHAGGDVASAIALGRIREADESYPDADTALAGLEDSLRAANTMIADAVYDHPELTGMGTTVSAILHVNGQVVAAHIGDSRIYLFRDGELNQVSKDHTFVQRLVDSGRITQEEAMVHPRRSVLMRVLGDVDADPDIDMWVQETRPGDRWLLCSDGLTTVVKDAELAKALGRTEAPRLVADRLIRDSLDGGAPDNVTVVILDVGDAAVPATEPETVGSAASPISFAPEEPHVRAMRIPSLRRHPMRPASGPTHFEPETEEYLDELIDEDLRRARRRRITWLAGILVLVAAIIVAGIAGYQWTQTRYYVGVAPDGNVAIYQGVQQTLGPISLSHVYRESDLPVDDLGSYNKQQVTDTINAESLDDAKRIVKALTDAAQ